MNATERVVQQLNARRIRDGEYRAKCPVHRGQSDTSLSIKHAGDRVLIHCHAGCELRDILSALGMKSAAELFDSIQSKRNPELERRARALRGLEIWAEHQLTLVCRALREVERSISLCVQSVPDSLPDMESMTEETRDVLAQLYHLRSDLDREWYILTSDDQQAKVELWRRYR